MQISAASFSDPALRGHWQKYYEQHKQDAIDCIRARDERMAAEGRTGPVTARLPDGSEMQAIPMTVDFVEKAFVGFDRWLEMQAQMHDNFGGLSLARAQEAVDTLKQNDPDSSSGVRAAFGRDGALLAYVTAEGGLVTSNGAHDLQDIAEEANRLNLRGAARADYLKREVGRVLGERFRDLDVRSYRPETAPSKREFAQDWYPWHDVDRHYYEGLDDAYAHLEGVKAWHAQWQKNVDKMQRFMIEATQQAPVRDDAPVAARAA